MGSLHIVYCLLSTFLECNILLRIQRTSIAPQFKVQMRPRGKFAAVPDDRNHFTGLYEVAGLFQQGRVVFVK